MSDNEFDQYLSLLSSLLRLDPAQRDSISGELRDHMEERLGELLEQGIDREQAVSIALEEFGDAAGLAAQFVSISRQQRKRWIMRITTGSALAVVGLIALALVFWPVSEGGPTATTVIAQEAGGGGNPFAGGPGAQAKEKKSEPTIEENNKETEQKLAKRVPAEFLETPLSDVVAYLSDVADVSFYINRRAIEEGGNTAEDQPITIDLARVRIDMLLDLVLSQLDLDYIVRDGIVIITTPQDVENVAEVRVYNCRDLLALPARGNKRTVPGSAAAGADYGGGAGAFAADIGGGPAGGGPAGGGGRRSDPSGAGFVPGGDGQIVGKPRPAADELIQLVTNTVMPHSWSEVGGPGTIGEFQGLLVINHNPRVHRHIEQLLEMMRSANEDKSGSAVRPKY